MIPPTEVEWRIHREVCENHPVYLIAKNYSLTQEKVIEIYCKCLSWRESEEGELVRNYSNNRRRYRRH